VQNCWIYVRRQTGPGGAFFTFIKPVKKHGAKYTIEAAPKIPCYEFRKKRHLKEGTYEFDESKIPDASYNPSMGDTWTRFDEKTGIKTKVRPLLNRTVAISENS
jgi:hypothetical protein